MTTFLITLGGGLGAVLRYLVDGALRRRLVEWSTAVINTTGSFVLGVLAGLAAKNGVGGETLAIIGTGVCGGYTTFSTASLNTVHLVRERRYGAALANGVGMLVAAVACAIAGIVLGRAGI